MNKKIIYLVFFIFIFVSGVVTMANPVRGDEYEFGVPEITRVMKLEGEGRVILYDEDEWNDHLGEGADNPDDYFGKYADVVGAKSKGKLVGWEEDEIDFLERNEIRAGKLILVANRIIGPKGGAAHGRNRRWGTGNAYCYTEEKFVPNYLKNKK